MSGQILTFIRYGRRRYNDICIVLILKALAENVHMQGTKETEATTLAKCRGSLSLYSDTSVSQSQLSKNPEVKISVQD